MSANQPVRPQRRELEIIRVLFDRHLSERAVALAESRWPGSGEMVSLAYEWAELSPADRRERLENIGPDEIAKMRSLASLNPDLYAAVEELDRRGVLPHLEDAAIAGAGAAAAANASASAPAEESRTGSPGGIAIPDETSEANRPEVEDPEHPATNEPVAEAEPQPAHPPNPPAPMVSVEEQDADLGQDVEGLDLEALSVDMPELDLGLPGTSEFLRGEQERREKAIRDAEASMDRVRQRLDSSADRITGRTTGYRPTPPAPFTPEVTQEELPALADADRSIAADADSTRRQVVEAPGKLLEAFARQNAVTVPSAGEAPTDDELVALANELGVPLQEFDFSPGRMREVFGGLVRRGSSVEVEAGPFPQALMMKNLAIVRGRIHHKLVDRLNEGFADIPGTRATVQLHDQARILIIPY